MSYATVVSSFEAFKSSLSHPLNKHTTLCRSPCDLEDPKESYTAENRDAQRRHDGQFHQDSLYDASTHHETVKAVKQGHKVSLQPQAVHLY